MGFINFTLREQEKDKKTLVWDVDSVNGAWLGRIKFYGAWRKYTYQPAKLDQAILILDADCLNEIASFCVSETNKWRENLKGRKEDAQI